MEIDARVGSLVGLHLGGELEVLEGSLPVGADVVKVALATAELQHTVSDRIGTFGGVLRGLPAREGLAVEEGDGVGGEASGGCE